MFLTEFSITDYILPIVLGLGIGLLFALGKNAKNYKPLFLNPEDFRSNMRKGQLLDVRTVEQFSVERINGSRNFPKKEIFQNLHLIRKDQPIFLYGETDRGLVKAVGKKLMKKGYKPVYILTGGMKDWPFVRK